MSVKQVILVREDLEMPEGKLAVQVAHASVNAILNNDINISMKVMTDTILSNALIIPLTKELNEWKNGEYKKIVLKVKNKNELDKYFNKAREANLPCSYITDNAHTVFNEPTTTCAAIGPANDEDIDKITKRLRLY